MAKSRGVRGAAGACAAASLVYLLGRSLLALLVSALMGLAHPGASLAKPLGFSDVSAALFQLLVGIGAIALTLAIAMSAKYLRQVRATVLDELSKDYVLGARARGVKFSTTLIKSVMKASLVTIITLLTLSIGSLLGGTAIVESIFMWDGVGKLAVDAINMRDYPIFRPT